MSNGPKFFQTVMGKKFFEGDVPRLVRALERIAKSLEQKEPLEPKDFNTKVQQRAAAMMDSGPMEIGKLTLRSGYPDADDLTITAGDQQVVISKDEHGDVHVAVDELFTFKLGESFVAGSEP